MKYIPWIVGVFSLWLMGAPFFFEYNTTAAAMWNDIVVGLVMLLSAAVWAYRESWGINQRRMT